MDLDELERLRAEWMRLDTDDSRSRGECAMDGWRDWDDALHAAAPDLFRELRTIRSDLAAARADLERVRAERDEAEAVVQQTQGVHYSWVSAEARERTRAEKAEVERARLEEMRGQADFVFRVVQRERDVLRAFVERCLAELPSGPLRLGARELICGLDDERADRELGEDGEEVGRG